MSKTIKNIFILIAFIMFAILFYMHPVYADTSASDKQELINMLDQYKNDLGDLNQLKTVVDKIYADINSTTNVDDNLKQTLKNDINMLDNVSGINPLILTILKSELNSQVDQLNNDNLSELKEEVQVIKDWIDEQLEGSNTGDTNTTNTDNTTEGTTQNNTINNKQNQVTSSTNTNKNTTTQIAANQNKAFMLPNTGVGRTMILIVLILVITSIGSIIKYRKLRGIK